MSDDRKTCIALGTLPDLIAGWAIIPFAERPHWWLADEIVMFHGKPAMLYHSACGLRTALFEGQKPIVPGNFPKCKRCERSMTEAKG